MGCFYQPYDEDDPYKPDETRFTEKISEPDEKGKPVVETEELQGILDNQEEPDSLQRALDQGGSQRRSQRRKKARRKRLTQRKRRYPSRRSRYSQED